MLSKNRLRERRKEKKKAQDSNENHANSKEHIEYDFIRDLKSIAISGSIELEKQRLKQLFQDCSDFVIRRFQLEQGTEALAVFIDGLIDTDVVNDTLRTLMVFEGDAANLDELELGALPVSQIQFCDTYDSLILSILGGDTAIFMEGEKRAIVLGVRGTQMRSISEPETETVVRGPREGFIENIRTNTSMLRRKLKTPHLKMRSLVIGKQSNTSIVVTYLDHLANPETVNEVMERLKHIEIDAILESGYIEELIQDQVYTPFPQIQYTERPDTVAGALLEGRIAILTDGTPFALIVPTTFWMLMQSSEDYYERRPVVTIIRWVRYLFLVLSLLTPALYIAATAFHSDLVPTTLLLSIASARESIPFPVVLETLIMEITFEALREAGVRLPKAIGQTVSILGALVVGSAAVEAGIVSAPIVIVVSITGIASFTIPRYSGANAIRLLRFPLLFAASLFGMYGIFIGMMVILGHMASLRSVGVPYLSPIAPLHTSGLKDVFVRRAWYEMVHRPDFLGVQDSRRISKQFHQEIAEQEGQKGEKIAHDKPPSKE